jgi:small nuclear ribonucleoprotein (snRNP)-like protein
MKDLSAKTGLSIETKNGADFTAYLTKVDQQIKGILKKAGLYRSGAKH